MPVKSQHRAYTTAVEIEADSLDLGHGLYAVEAIQTETVTRTGGKDQVKTTTVVGVVNRSNLNKILRGEDYTTQPVYALDSEQIDFLRTHGYRALMDRDHKKLDGQSVLQMMQHLEMNYTLVKLDSGSHQIVTLDDKPLAGAMFFDYIDAAMHNGLYDIRKAAEILLARNDVRLFPVAAYGGRADHDGTATTVEEALLEVPYYNRDLGHTEFLEGFYQPTPQDYEKIYARATELRPDYPPLEFFRAIYDLDILGLRAGGAALTQDFYKRVSCQDGEDHHDY